MKNNPLIQLEKTGQSVWLDFINRKLIISGELRQLIENDGLSGMTTNPAIFEKAISEVPEYAHDITIMLKNGKDAKSIYEELCLKDLQMVADELKPLYDRTKAANGYVSMEVDPHLANDTEATIKEARRLWASLKRPNVFIKVPATAEGLPAIQQLISEGINVNITLLFGLPRYRQVAEAYIAGLEEREARGGDLKSVASVASFFVSRIDSIIDPYEGKFSDSNDKQAYFNSYVKGNVAISSAKLAYQIYKEMFGGERFRKLSIKGAMTQQLLWASTSTKNPAYSDIKYVEELIGRDTINTMTPATINAYRDHGNPKIRIEDGIEQAQKVMDKLQELGINIDKITQDLEDDGIQKFNEQFDKIILKLKQQQQ